MHANKLVEKIEKVLDSDLTAYRIAKEVGYASANPIHKLRSGDSEVESMKISTAIQFEKLYEKMEELEMGVKAWVRDTYTVEMVEFDHDLKAFEITQGDKTQTIYPGSIEDMEEIIDDLDNGEDVNGWEDGLGNTIVID